MPSSPCFRSGKDRISPAESDAGDAGELLVLSGAVAALEIKAIADDSFEDQMVGRAGKSHTESEIDFPLRREIQVNRGEDLLLLLMNWQEVGSGPDRAVILQAAGNLGSEVVAEFEIRREHEALVFCKAVNGFVECWIKRPIPAAHFLVNDGTHLPSPCVGGKLAALIAYFIRQADADGPVPLFGDAEAGADMVANPLPSLSGARRGEDIESHLEPIGEAVGDFDGFVFG